MDANQLRIEAEKLRLRAQLRRRELEEVMDKATNFSEAGDFSRAQTENKLAARIEQEAMQFERSAMEHDERASDLELKAIEIEKRQSHIQTETQAQIDKLEAKKRSLRGDID